MYIETQSGKLVLANNIQRVSFGSNSHEIVINAGTNDCITLASYTSRSTQEKEWLALTKAMSRKLKSKMLGDYI